MIRMSWLSKIFRPSVEKTEERKLGATEMSIDEISAHVKEKIREKDSSHVDDLKGIHEKMKSVAHDYSDALKTLEESAGPDKVDPALMKVARSYVSAMRISFNNAFMEFEKPVAYNTDEFSRFFNRCAEMFVGAEKSSMRYVAILKQIFPKEMESVLKQSDRMSETMESAKGQISSRTSDLRPLLDMSDSVEKLRAAVSKIDDLMLKMAESRIGIESMKTDIESTNQKMSELMSSSDWKEYQERSKEIEEISKRREEIFSLVVQTISPLDKAMKRLRKMCSDGVEKVESETMLDLYIGDPVDAFVKDKEQSVIREIISKIKENSVKGRLQIDTEKEQKILENISVIESRGLLPTLRRDLDDLENQMSTVKKILSSSNVQGLRSGYESSLRDLSSRMSDAESTTRAQEATLKRAQDDVAAALREAEEKASATIGEKITIKLSQEKA